MMPDFAVHDIDAELVFDRFLGANELDKVQQLLVDAAPRWCSNLRVWKSPRKQVPIDLSRPDALATTLLAAAGERGETYWSLVEKHGQPQFDRFMGSAELRGAGSELVVVISVDQMVLSPLGSTMQLGNQLSIQVRRPKVEGMSGADWLRSSFPASCAALAPAWGSARHPAEYWTKVMSDGPKVRAVGRDFGRFLPGVFWLNFYGAAYRNMIGVERLCSSPGAEAAVIDDGVLVTLAADPHRWNEAEFAAAEQNIEDHVGSGLFYSKADPDRTGIVPRWG